jgi:hypothetical protein
MIQERADALAALIARQRELTVQVRQLEGFRGQLQEVTQTIARFAPLVRTWRLFRERGIGNAAADAQAAALLLQVAQLRERYESDRASILGPNRLASLRSVHTLANALQVRLLGEWQEHARGLVPSVNNEVLNVLSRISALKAGVDAVWVGLRDLDACLQRLPSGAVEVDAFEARAADVRRKWDAFDTAHLLPEVLQFLKDAGGTGAGLDALTDTVRDWLRENNLADAFRIRSVSAVASGR